GARARPAPRPRQPAAAVRARPGAREERAEVKELLAAMLLLVPAAPKAPTAPCPVTFTDVAPSVGLRFLHVRGATPAHQLPETMGSGIAWLDYDNDGWMDLYVVQSGVFAPGRDAGHGTGDSKAQDRLFHNNGNGTFTDVTEKAKLRDDGYGMGAVAADYDN